MNIKKLNWWLNSVAGTPAVTFDFGAANSITGSRGFKLQYNTTDFSYLSSAPYSDTGSFLSAVPSNVIGVNTFFGGGGGSNFACAGVGYYMDFSDPTGAGDKVVFCESGASGDNNAHFYARLAVDGGTISQLFEVSNAQQSFAIDPINSYVIAWIGSPNRIQVRDFNDNIIETLSITTSLLQGMIAYNYFTGDLYLASETSAARIERFRKVAGAWVLQETMWFSSVDGVAVDFLNNRIINYPGSGSSALFRYQSMDGKSRVQQFNLPIATITTEGIVVDPRDGTLWFADPSGYNIHGNITNGNRGWHVDPEKKYLKFANSPHMIPWTKWKHNGTITGQQSQSYISGASSVISPIYNVTGFTNHHNLSAFQDMDGTQLTSLEFRGSDTPPTTTELDAVACSVNYFDANGTNDGWGATTPSAWSSSPPVGFDYIQVRQITPSSTPADSLTVDDLVNGLGSTLVDLLLPYDSTLNHVNFASAGPVNQMSVLINQKDPLNNWQNATDSQRFSYNVAGRYADDQNANQAEARQTVTALNALSQGQVTVIVDRVASTTTAVITELGTLGSNNSRILLKWHSNGFTVAHEVCFEIWNAAGSVIQRIGVAKNETGKKQIDFRCGASSKSILYSRVNQTLNVSVGSNDGTWFDDLAGPPNSARIGLGNGGQNNAASVTFRFKCILSAPATDDVEGNIHTRFPAITSKQDLINAFIDQNSLLS